MVPIYLCDDEKETRDFLAGIIQQLTMVHDYDMKIVLSTGDPEAVLQERGNQCLRSIYFFDVDLQHEKYDGFRLAKEIRSLDPRGFIIFISTHEELIFETFKYRLEAMSYLIKDNPEKLQTQLQACLTDIQALLSQENTDQDSYFTVKAESHYQIPIKDIISFETAAPHRIVLNTRQRRIEFRGDLKQIASDLGEKFIKIHRSYLIQGTQIAAVDYTNNFVEMNNGSNCLMSRKGKKILKNYLAERSFELLEK